jgi:peptidyl-prolyl cis-trans isomerase SurA
MMYLEKVQPALRVYLTKLREDAYIDVRPGFVDTGASSNQSNLIFKTVSTDDDKTTPAKNKKKKRLGVF